MDATRDLEMSPLAESAFFSNYADRLARVLRATDWPPICRLAEDLLRCWRERRQVLICGNGGSAANAMHIANDLIYGISKQMGAGLRIHALPSNTSIMTCLANDEGYEAVFSHQVGVLAEAGDLLLVLSGSGNSPNILRALDQARRMGVKSYAILGYDGGKAKALADVPIHVGVNDMQIAEDLQLIVAHMVMQWLHEHRCGDVGS
jgi:D-sedoheptulose 7-phosphate isomerase